MLLNNVLLVNSTQPINIAISGGKIVATGADTTSFSDDNKPVHFKNAIAFPGLINSHDHLDFNCFSPLGQKKYSNYTEWGNHLHKTYRQDIDAVLKIPQNLRAAWGMYKNLITGVTTVINHGDFLKIENPLINIYQDPQSLHSVKFQKNWKWKLNNPILKNKTCVIHTGEGVDKTSSDEIDKLLQWNLLKRKLIGVHAVAMNAAQAKKFAGLVWCPESNNLLLGRHADITRLKEKTRLVFGTDSTLSGNWNIWQHLRMARALELVTDKELFEMATHSAAQLWGLNTGKIQPGKDADIVIAKTKNRGIEWNDFFSINPEDILLVLHKGQIRMFDIALLYQLNKRHVDLNKFTLINIHQAAKFIEGDLPALMDVIRSYHPAVTLPPGVCAINKNTVHD